MANKDFETVSENWNRLGAINPLWAILTSDENWDMEVFLKTGEQEIDRRIKQVQEFHPIDVGRALDFGCGVGRLTQPLAKHFEQVDGVDVAQTMIDIARDINRFGGRCTYHHNEKSDLTLFPDDTFDFINSSLVLQHIPRPASLNYIREFMRVLKPGGLAFFQVVNTCGTASNNIQQQYPVLPSHAFNAQLTVLNLPAKMTSNRTYEVMVRVKNLSNYNKPDGDNTPLTPAEHDGVIWHGATFIRAKRSIKLGNHWWDESGRPVKYDDGRTPLPHDILPDFEVDIPIKVTAPATAGRYTLEFDMVQEGVAWFGKQGSATSRHPVTVRRNGVRLRSTPPAQPTKESLMNMYPLKLTEVIGAVRAGGGSVLDIIERGDLNWTQYIYYCTK